MKITLIYTLFFLFFSGFTPKEEASYTAYVFLHESCKISQFYTVELNKLQSEYGESSVEIIGIFPNASTTIDNIDSFRNQYKIEFDLVKDVDQKLTKQLRAGVTPEVVIVNNKTSEIIYQGRIDDAYFRVGKRRTVTTSSEMRDVISELAQGKQVTPFTTEAIGCLIQDLP